MFGFVDNIAWFALKEMNLNGGLPVEKLLKEVILPTRTETLVVASLTVFDSFRTVFSSTMRIAVSLVVLLPLSHVSFGAATRRGGRWFWTFPIRESSLFSTLVLLLFAFCCVLSNTGGWGTGTKTEF